MESNPFPTSTVDIKNIKEAIDQAINIEDSDRLHSLLQEWRDRTDLVGPTPRDLDFPLARALQDHDNVNLVATLLSSGAEMSESNITRAKSVTMFTLFKAHGWRPDSSILHYKIAHPDLVRFFLAHGVNPQPPGSQEDLTILDLAALRGPLDSVEALIAAGAAPAASPGALNAAAQGDVPGRIPVMACLLAHGANIQSMANDFPGDGEAMRSGRKGTPLHAAAKWGFQKGTAWLLEHGADAEALNEMGETPEQWGKRFDRDGSERVVRLRRDINRKGRDATDTAREKV